MQPRPSQPCRYRFLLRLLWVCACLIVIGGSLLPSSSAPIRVLDALHIGDKLEHFTAYAVLAFLPALHEKRPTLAAIAFGIVGMGICLEFSQRLSQGRFFEVADMMANTAGTVTGLMVGLPSRHWISSKLWNARPSRV